MLYCESTLPPFHCFEVYGISKQRSMRDFLVDDHILASSCYFSNQIQWSRVNYLKETVSIWLLDLDVRIHIRGFLHSWPWKIILKGLHYLVICWISRHIISLGFYSTLIRHRRAHLKIKKSQGKFERLKLRWRSCPTGYLTGCVCVWVFVTVTCTAE